MDDFSEEKKDILKCLGVIAEDVIDLPNSPTKMKTRMVVDSLYEVMLKLEKMSEA